MIWAIVLSQHRLRIAEAHLKRWSVDRLAPGRAGLPIEQLADNRWQFAFSRASDKNQHACTPPPLAVEASICSRLAELEALKRGSPRRG
jgi:hypothetical protein